MKRISKTRILMYNKKVKNKELLLLLLLLLLFLR